MRRDATSTTPRGRTGSRPRGALPARELRGRAWPRRRPSAGALDPGDRARGGAVGRDAGPPRGRGRRRRSRSSTARTTRRASHALLHGAASPDRGPAAGRRAVGARRQGRGRHARCACCRTVGRASSRARRNRSALPPATLESLVAAARRPPGARSWPIRRGARARARARRAQTERCSSTGSIYLLSDLARAGATGERAR